MIPPCWRNPEMRKRYLEEVAKEKARRSIKRTSARGVSRDGPRRMDGRDIWRTRGRCFRALWGRDSLSGGAYFRRSRSAFFNASSFRTVSRFASSSAALAIRGNCTRYFSAAGESPEPIFLDDVGHGQRDDNSGDGNYYGQHDQCF
jgi:hypothetical protein